MTIKCPTPPQQKQIGNPLGLGDGNLWFGELERALLAGELVSGWGDGVRRGDLERFGDCQGEWRPDLCLGS